MNIHTVFSTVVYGTVLGSVVGIIILILKSTLLRRLSAKWQYLLWSVMILKLVLPNGPESKISIFNQINVIDAFNETEILPFTQKPKPISIYGLQNISEIIPHIWIGGIILTTLWIIISFVFLRYKIHSSSSSASENTIAILNRCKNITGINSQIKVIVQSHIPTTSLYGVIKPEILITEEFENDYISKLEYTFIHELCHYRRCDVLVNYLLLFFQCIHWFNPVMWYLFKKIRQDMELATDEMTMTYIKPNEHKSYGMVLINTLRAERTPNILGIASNKKEIKKRIKAISKFKKPKYIHNISGFITLILIATICLTSAVAAKPISDAIYKNIPKIDVLSPDKNIFKFGKKTYNNSKPERMEEQKKIIEKDKSDELTVTEDITVVENTSNIIDLNKYATTISYNTDYKGIYTVRVNPNSSGNIQLNIENDNNYNHIVKIGISNTETKGYGWDYQFTTEEKTPIYLDGYDPDEEYFVTIDCYCPGHYNINGTILIY